MDGLTDRGNPNDPGSDGHAGVHREVPSTQELAELGGKSTLTPGYKKGGSHKHFHVHKHYHSGGKVKSNHKSYSMVEGAGEMQAEQRFGRPRSAGGFGQGTTGSSRPKLAKGGKMHIKPENKGKFTKKMTGSKKGHLTGSDVQRGLHSESGETRKEANFARMARRHFKPLTTGGTINKMSTGGTRNTRAAGGALYKRGGHSSEMKHHLDAPAPRGHKGMGDMIRRGGK
jgi:hypothetical protein